MLKQCIFTIFLRNLFLHFRKVLPSKKILATPMHFRSFSSKNGFFWKEKMLIFLKMDSFTKLCIVLKNETSLSSGWPSPPDPLRERVIAFKWPEGSPPPNNHGDATVFTFLLNIFGIAASSPKVYTPWKITPVFYNNSSDFGEETFWRSTRGPPDSPEQESIIHL